MENYSGVRYPLLIVVDHAHILLVLWVPVFVRQNMFL